MQKRVVGFFAALMMTFLGLGCASNPNKAEKIDTSLENAKEVTGDTQLGIKDGNMMVQQKVLMSEELRRLQYEVYELEDHVYGNRKYGSDGKYGVLKRCREELASRENGGSGKLSYLEPMDRVSDKEEEFKIGLDKKNQLVGLSEEFLKDRIGRFRQYKSVLQKREDEYTEKVRICENELKNRKLQSQYKGEE
jgi:hypothetical protein